MESTVAEILGCGGQQSFAEAGRAVFGEHAHLSDVPNVGTHPRAEDQADQGLVAALEDHEGCLGIESAASGEAHYVVEKAQRAGEGAVLIVDLGIDMAAVGGGDQRGGGLVFLLGPGTDFKLGRKRRQSRERSLRMLADNKNHEDPGMPAYTLVQKSTRA